MAERLPLLSVEPRPHTQPSARSPLKGRRFQASGVVALTTSRWASKRIFLPGRAPWIRPMTLPVASMPDFVEAQGAHFLGRGLHDAFFIARYAGLSYQFL